MDQRIVELQRRIDRFVFWLLSMLLKILTLIGVFGILEGLGVLSIARGRCLLPRDLGRRVWLQRASQPRPRHHVLASPRNYFDYTLRLAKPIVLLNEGLI